MLGINKKLGRLLALVIVMLGLMSNRPNGATVDATAENPIMSYDFLYKEGVESYLQENWAECIKQFEMALQDWHWWKTNLIRCRRKCNQEGSEGTMFSAGLSEEEKFFEKTVRSTLCLVKCKKETFGSRMDRVAEAHIEEDFELKKPYDYLQLCYYKSKMLKEAADASATVLAEQPEHEVMKNNLKYYLAEGEIKPESVVNRELKEYGKLYIQGNTAYNNNNYEETIHYMEESVDAYYNADDDCRRLCENPFDQGWFPDFVSSIANHYTYTLRCKRRCEYQLSNLYGERIENFFASYFNYLQYSYFQEGDFKRACEAVASSLVIYPKDEVQLRNKDYYLSEHAVSEEMFVPRPEVVMYKQRLDFEEKMMDFIETNFIFLNDEEFLEDVDEDVEKKKEASVLGIPSKSLGTNSSSLEDKLDSETVILETQSVAKEEL